MVDDKKTSNTLSTRIKYIALAFFGAIIIIVGLALFKANIYVFTVFLCMYIGIYSTLVIIYLNQKTDHNNPELGLLINVSMYTICLIIAIAIFAIILMNDSAQFRTPTKY